MEEETTTTATPTSNLETLCQNMTELYYEKKLDNIFHRDEEVDFLLRILSKKKKNNAILIGDAGVGKTSIINVLIERIENFDVPSNLFNKKIYSLDTNNLVAGTKFRGELENRIKKLLEEIKNKKNIILFIDEIHTIKNDTTNNSVTTFGDILKPYIINSDIQVIGTTTYDDYKKVFEKDKALGRRFHKIDVKEPSVETCKEIVKKLTPSYESFHNVTYPLEIVETIPELAKKYIKNKKLPDSAIDVLDEVGANIRCLSKLSSDKNKEYSEILSMMDKEKIDIIRKEEWSKIPDYIERKNSINEKLINTKGKIVSEKDILNVISIMSNIPLDKLNETGIDRIKKLDKDLHKNVIGQNEAIEKILKSLKRYVIGVNNPNKPISVNLLNGVTGCGKTFLVQELAKHWNNDQIVRLDMSEFQEKFTVSNIIGAASGHVGYDKGGRLTEAVKNNPYSIILLDEIEKAHKDVLNLFLQVFDNGELTDNQNNTVSFRNCIIFMTSNLGAKDSQTKKVGYIGGETKDKDKSSLEAINKYFTPEFINRIDNIIIFNTLTKENLDIILDNEIEKINILLEKKNVKIVLNKNIKNHLIEKGFDSKYGARPLKRTLETLVIDPLTDYLIDNPDVKKIMIDYKDKVIFKTK